MRRLDLPTRLLSRSLGVLFLASACACAHGASAAETLPKLRAAMESEVSSPEQNAQNSALVQQVSEAKQLQGMSREEVEEKLGQGDKCSRHPLCGERGFDSEDWYYEVGRAGASYVRHRPSLIVGFSRFGKVERTFVLRAPD
ncbi:MAG: hypothetical protein JWN48_1725 [Myxococcaceae bacterium]|nr:hypothetical protein [Myxococcaceae bacterium]